MLTAPIGPISFRNILWQYFCIHSMTIWIPHHLQTKLFYKNNSMDFQTVTRSYCALLSRIWQSNFKVMYFSLSDAYNYLTFLFYHEIISKICVWKIRLKRAVCKNTAHNCLIPTPISLINCYWSGVVKFLILHHLI